jgi:signal transduction histidine kinase
MSLFWLLVGVVQAVEAPASSIELSPRQPWIGIAPGQAEGLFDATGRLTLAEVTQSRDWVATQGDTLAGYRFDPYWLRLTLHRPPGAPGEWWLEVQPSHFDEVSLFVPDGAGGFTERMAGDTLPFAVREIPYRTPVFRIHLAEDQHLTVYLRVRSTNVIQLFPRLWQPWAFQAATAREMLLLGGFVGLMLALLVVNLVEWWAIREKIFLVYVVHLLLGAIAALGDNGLIYQFLLPDTPLWANDLSAFGICLLAAVALRFYAHLLQLRDHWPWTNRLYRWGSFYALLTTVNAFNPMASVFGILLAGLSVLTIAVSLFSIAPIVRLWRTEQSGGRWIAVACALFMLTMSSNVALYLGLMDAPRWWVLYALLVGTALHLSVLHMGIAQQVRAWRIEAERARREAEQERAAREEQGQFLRMLTHELRTPLSIIDAATQTLVVLDPKPDDERGKRYDRIRRAIRRLNTLFEHCLTEDRLRADAAPEKPGTVNINRLVNEAIATLGSEAERRVRTTRFDDSLPPIIGDRGLLMFVVVNLLDNALKYSPIDQVVEVALAAERQTDSAWICLTVSDQGPGLAPGEEERVFERYYRGAERRDQPGLGLGLYLARRVVERHGGRLTAERPATSGGCFICRLPAYSGPASLLESSS